MSMTEEKKEEQPTFQVSDRRFWAQDESLIERAPEPQTRYPTFVEELKARTELAEQKLREKIEKLDRENEEFRARFRKEAEKRAERQTFQILRGFLEVIDNLDRALEAARQTSDIAALQEGVQLSVSLFLSKLKAAGIEPLELEGQPYDPNQAEAVGAVEVADPDQDQTVQEVVQRGYRWGDQLLRPARVRVGQFQGEAEAESPR